MSGVLRLRRDEQITSKDGGSAGIGASYTYDSAGRLSTASYPITSSGAAATYTYAYDGMGHPVSMTGVGTGPVTQWVQNGQYDAAGHMTSMTLSDGVSSHTRTKTMAYNPNGQLASVTWASPPLTYPYYYRNLEYSYVGTEMTGYTDSLTGLTTGGGYSYNNFGNLTSGAAVNLATNQLVTSYDANGNMLAGMGATFTYDSKNRMASASPTSGGTEYYGYAANNKRIYRWEPSGAEEWTFYGGHGERIGVFSLNTSGPTFVASQTNVWFAGQLLDNANGLVQRDPVGTDLETGAEYYPYGQEITSTPNGIEKYATYFRDAFTTLDYADQRYYSSTYGRFTTVDPKASSADPRRPETWNRYSYAGGDPVNRNDPRGLDDDDDDYDGYGSEESFLASEGTSGQTGYYDPNASGTGAVSTMTITYDGGGQEVFTGTQTLGDQDPMEGVLSGYSSIISFSGSWSLTWAGGLIGSAFGPGGTAVGSALGTLCAGGFNFSYVPSTKSLYFGPVLSCSAVPGGASGFLLSKTLIPITQNPNHIANGPSGSLTILPRLGGSTVTKSPGSGPPVVGIGVGNRTPISVGGGYNFCIWNCQTQ